MKTLKKDWLIWLMLLIPFALITFTWNRLPDQIATHFDMEGKPNDYSGKFFGTFFLPLLNIAMYFLLLLLPKIDPRKKNYQLFDDKYRIIRLVLHSFMTFTFFVSILYALGYPVNIALLIVYGTLTLFLILGNYMGNVRPNFFVGVRTPWTLSNEQVWMKTHRFTGKLWVVSTILAMVIIPFIPSADIVFGIYLAVIIIAPIAYSYIEYKKEQRNG
ncbi:MAG: SdpI family protein [Bacteroidia bacterium]